LGKDYDWWSVPDYNIATSYRAYAGDGNKATLTGVATSKLIPFIPFASLQLSGMGIYQIDFDFRVGVNSVKW